MTSPAVVKRFRAGAGISETMLNLTDFASASTSDDLLVAILPAKSSDWPDTKRIASGSVHRFRAKGVRIERWLGRAVLSAPAGDIDNLLAALIVFDGLERELVKLESDLATKSLEARSDAKEAFVASYSKRADWPRIRERIVQYTELRMAFAELEPRLNAVPHSVPPGVRRWLAPMLRKSDLADRAEALDGILETREDLYEGASDRIADYWGWLYGHVLEIIIIALLLIEAVFMGLDLMLRLRES